MLLYHWSEEENNKLKKLYPITREWQILFDNFPNRTKKSIHRQAYRLKIKKARNYKNTNKHKKDLFNIWNEKSAYLLGYLEADGYFIECKNLTLKIKFNMTKKDESFCIKLKHLTETTGKTYYSKQKIKGYDKIHECCGFYISSDQWYIDLLDKYRIGKIPDCITEDLLPHYIRGYFDGDGWVCWSKQGGFYSTGFIFSTPELAECFAKILRPIVNAKLNVKRKHKISETSKLITNSDCNNAWTIALSKNATIKLGNYIYKNATTYLDRKYSKILEAIINANPD